MNINIISQVGDILMGSFAVQLTIQKQNQGDNLHRKDTGLEVMTLAVSHSAMLKIEGSETGFYNQLLIEIIIN